MGGLASKRNQSSVSVLIGGSSLQGIRNYNEDRLSIVHPLVPPKIPKDRSTSLFAVYDGHGGEWTAEYTEKHLSECISGQIAYAGKHKEKALTRGYWACDNRILAEQEKGAEKSGTTAVSVLLDHDYIYCANIGDSRALLYRAGKIIELSLDHKPNLPEERKRIENAGGRVQPSVPIPINSAARGNKRKSMKTDEEQQNHLNHSASAVTIPAPAPVPASVPVTVTAIPTPPEPAISSPAIETAAAAHTAQLAGDEQPQTLGTPTAKQPPPQQSLSASAASNHHSKSQSELTQPPDNHSHDQPLSSQQSASNLLPPNNVNSTTADSTSGASTADIIINTTSLEPAKSVEANSSNALPTFNLPATGPSQPASASMAGSAAAASSSSSSSASTSSSLFSSSSLAAPAPSSSSSSGGASSFSSSSSASSSSRSHPASSSSSTSRGSSNFGSGPPADDHIQYYAELGDKALAVSRAFGNLAFKQNPSKKPAEQIIVCIPHIVKIARSTPADAFLLLGSDGIFNFISNDTACQFVETRILRRLSSQLPVLPKGERPIITSGEIEEIAGELTQHALDKKSNDNVTAVLVVFKEWIDSLTLEELKKWRSEHKDDTD